MPQAGHALVGKMEGGGMLLRIIKFVANVNPFLKKTQKSINCSICNYWFCLDCSHLSVKMYDMLRAESTPNTPFHCSGCVRIVPKLVDMNSLIQKQNEKLSEYDKKFSNMESSLDAKIEKQVEKSLLAFREREDRKCNIILHNVAEPTSEDKKEEDQGHIKDIIRSVKCEEVKVESFFRLGKPADGRKRLIKVCLDSVSSKHKMVGGTKVLREKKDGKYTPKWSNVFITPDLTKEEMDKSRELRTELKRRKEVQKNGNLVIFRGSIIDKNGKNSKQGEEQSELVQARVQVLAVDGNQQGLVVGLGFFLQINCLNESNPVNTDVNILLQVPVDTFPVDKVNSVNGRTVNVDFLKSSQLNAQTQTPGEELNKHSCFRSDLIVCFMLVSCSPCNHVQFMRQ